MYLHAFLLTCITVYHTVLVSSFHRGTSHEPVSVCVRLCLSVCVRLSQVGVLLKRLNGGSQKQHHYSYSYSLTDVNIFSFRYYLVNKYNTAPHDTPKTLVFWCQWSPRNSTGVTRYDRGRRMQVGWVKIGVFWLITSYISKTVQDRHIYSFY